MSLRYHAYLTTERSPDGDVVYWAEHRETPWPAAGPTADAALAKLCLYTDAYLADCDARGIALKPFPAHPLVFDWTLPRGVSHGVAPEN